MARDGADTQTRILEAARTEFAAYGLAGARIDRIAKAASASKERMYAYYSDKRQLFLAVLELNLREFASAVVLVDNDVPAFAGALFDHAVAHPDHLRMIDWARLETDGTLTPSTDVVLGYRDEQVRRIELAQAAGTVDAAWAPSQLMTLIFGLISAWLHEPGLSLAYGREPDAAALAARRANVVHAVERLVEPRSRAAD
ncbi:TetR/AcrR family transcriptional regulator [Cryobacterium melibiosiphilum]|uniref:TetR/AcrR family transcriptional regulator n=1 Tax=Cryobacterium melibiosiphilum TaxID=995039 RepID=A0A3A5MGL5_9MICO|nr:TetR family transcriptional regulator [Cryobacterium melibiosiphilum]RJT84686.1 TetR/AcrR family transcriptional regulator [Cryobacterium melibiosiphilum]